MEITDGTQSAPIVKRLKGGSLSGTYLMEAGSRRWIRKDISLADNREYGYIRWHSQLKRLQRFGELFPGVFPRVLDVGREGQKAFFDLEYIEGSLSGFDFLAANPPEDEVQAYFDALVEAMDRLHSVRRSSWPGALDLYLYEEMERPLSICAEDTAFRDFLRHGTIVFNEVEVPSLVRVLPRIYEAAARHCIDPWECYTHGNLTLENTLWEPGTRRIWFIDPYEENIADSVLNEYSQVLQSSNSLYEIYNAMDPKVDGCRVELQAPPHPAIHSFNAKFLDLMRMRLSPDEMKLLKIYELSQFSRMLPFKLQVAREKMIFFYALASYLAWQVLEEINA